MSLPVANVKLVPKKKPEAAALFKPYLSTPFTAAWYLSQAAFSLAKDRTCHTSYAAENRKSKQNFAVRCEQDNLMLSPKLPYDL